MEAFAAAHPDGANDEATEAAQQLIYDAWEKTSARGRINEARKALTISPLCADAFSLLASEANSATEARDLYALGVEAGRLALGPDGFEEYEGEFWGFLETRPYMRARAGLAGALLRLGDEDGAIGHFREMLRLNPNDNQGVRYVLASLLLQREDITALEELLAAYDDEASCVWSYTRTLLAFRDHGASDSRTIARAEEAWSENEHVPAVLAGKKSASGRSDFMMIVGGVDEAAAYDRDFGAAWRSTPDAIPWLVRTAAEMKSKPRR